MPKTATVTMRLPRGAMATGQRVVLTLDGGPAETTAANNIATVGRPIGDAPGLPPRRELRGTTLSASRLPD
jgi:hypothetical protein